MYLHFFSLLALFVTIFSTLAEARPLAYVPQDAQVMVTKRIVLQANNLYLIKRYSANQPPRCYGFMGDGNPGPLFLSLNRPAKYIEASVNPVPVNDVIIEAGTALKVIDVQVERDVPLPDKYRTGDCKSIDINAEALGTVTLESTLHNIQIIVHGYFYNRDYYPDGDSDVMRMEFMDLDTEDLKKFTGIEISITPE